MKLPVSVPEVETVKQDEVVVESGPVQYHQKGIFICLIVGWSVGCFGLNGPFRQYFSLYWAVSVSLSFKMTGANSYLQELTPI